MATDNSEPRVGVILRVAILAVVTLVVLRAALVSYFDHSAQAEEERKMGQVKPEALMQLRADEKERLSSGPMPIDKAMQQLAARGRTASPEIRPTPSKDLAPLQGWIKMPSQVPGSMEAAQQSASPAVSAPADAGVSSRTMDAGASRAAAPEG
ncbi:MAG: hypothetical protein M3O36_00935, partial [Myxococcota bacterium]|nr:hypothetical protein [Myxococcota bacterium]